MGKLLKMLKIYKEVISGNEKEIAKVIPNMYCKNFYDIDFNYLINRNITNLIIDIDGTILPADDINVPKELINKFAYLKENNFSILLVSNNYEKRVKPVAEILKVDYLYKAKKPLPECFNKSLKKLNTNDLSKTAMIGDQMLTDIHGANNYGIYTVLVNPISPRNNIGTYINRKLQNKMEKYLKEKNIFDKDTYFNK